VEEQDRKERYTEALRKQHYGGADDEDLRFIAQYQDKYPDVTVGDKSEGGDKPSQQETTSSVSSATPEQSDDSTNKGPQPTAPTTANPSSPAPTGSSTAPSTVGPGTANPSPGSAPVKAAVPGVKKTES
jgi:hypothetical protein